MTKDDLDAIAKRETHCKPWGEAVTISRAERDQLVALARDGMRLRWLDRFAHRADWVAGEPSKLIICADTGEEFYGETWSTAIDAAMKEDELAR